MPKLKKYIKKNNLFNNLKEALQDVIAHRRGEIELEVSYRLEVPMNIHPFQDRLLVQKDKPAETSSGGIIVTPDQTDTPVHSGTVLAVGFGKGIDKHVAIAVGERVIFGKYNGVAVGDGLVILKEDEILATVTSDDTIINSSDKDIQTQAKDNDDTRTI